MKTKVVSVKDLFNPKLNPKHNLSAEFVFKNIPELKTESLRQELDMFGRRVEGNRSEGEPDIVYIGAETAVMEFFESTMSANDQVCCKDVFTRRCNASCDFKITAEQLENNYNGDEESASSELWDHVYSHIRKYGERK